ncbi:MAG TPA: phage tail protein [Myxococcaceae bacterium]|jgi:phage tail-like protein
MDANRLRFHLLAVASDWAPEVSVQDQRVAVYDGARRTLRLGSLTDPRTLDEATDPVAVGPRLALTPQALDAFSTWAFWDGLAKQVRAAGGGAGSALRFDPAAAGLVGDVTDLAPGAGGVLYVAVGLRVAAVSLRDQWEPVAFPKAGLDAYRLCADPRGGAWVLGGPPSMVIGDPPPALGRVDGMPLPAVLPIPSGEDLFRPVQENPDPPRTRVLATLAWPGEVAVALAAAPSGTLAVLSWVLDPAAAGVAPQDAFARVRLYSDGFSTPIALAGLKAPFSIRFTAERQLAALSLKNDGKCEAVAYDLDEKTLIAVPRGDYFPLPDHDGGPFLNPAPGVLPPAHGTTAGLAQPPTPLQALSLPQLARHGLATPSLDRILDAGSPRATWHRLYLEGVLPPRCGVIVWLSATDVATPPSAEDPGWQEHRFGAVPGAPAGGVPSGVWVPFESEVPFQPSMAPGDRSPGESGLFTVLIQRANRKVRSLTGRYLWMRVELFGDGRRTPEIAALRAYASRFSYAENYLPSLYREQLFGLDADAAGPATPSDFLERFLGIVEGVLTPIEDRVGDAHVLTDARGVPDESLEWLASWIGLTFDTQIPAGRRRAMLAAAPKLARRRGTLAGLQLALDVVTDGMVARGSVVVVEDYRLRRTFATILGADLSGADDPLLPGLTQSGNSFVGDTLFLGDTSQKELLALYGERVEKTAADAKAVDEFLARLAHRVTVLVHNGTDPALLGLLRRVAELEAPAHAAVSVVTASRPLMVGLASLVGADTFIGPPPELQPVRLGKSVLGLSDRIDRPAALDPRLEGG